MQQFGLAYATKTISVSFDPQQQQWIFSISTQDGQLQEIKHQALVGMTYSLLTGFEQVTPPISLPVQLTLPLAA